jgi:hypothetical protein
MEEDAVAWISDVADVTSTTVRRWLSGEREPHWREACAAAAALETPTWWFWVPAEEAPVLPPASLGVAQAL